MGSAGVGGAEVLEVPASSHRGFDGLMTPTGIVLVTASLALFIVVIVVGGLFWRMMAIRDSEARAARRAEARAAAQPEEPPA